MKRLLALAAAFMITVNAAMASDTELNVYPIPAVFTSKEVKLQNKMFSSLLENQRQIFIKHYIDTFYKSFTNATDEISDKIKYKTFAAYLNIPRVSMNIYDKGNNVDIYLPLTMSINFVNMATSETLYSYPFTYYAKYETTKEKFNNKEYAESAIQKLYADTYKDLTVKLTEYASNDFKPFAIQTKIIDSYRNMYVLNKGSTSGIAKGDLLTDEDENQLSVIYSDLNYSVAQIVLGKATDKPYQKYANSSLAQLKKPKILFINDFDSEKLYNIFSSALGQNAAFALINIDKTFYDMQSALVSLNMNFKNKNIHNRQIPDYFLKLYFTKPLYTQYKSTEEFFNVDRYAMLACGIIFDKSGRVVFSKCADEELTSKVASGIKFSDEAQFEIVAKNLLSKLAQYYTQEVKFKNTQFKIRKTSGEYIYLEDKDNLLSINNTLTVYKSIKTEKRGQKIYIPTWEYKVISIDDKFAECKPMYPIADNVNYPSKHDKVSISSVANRKNNLDIFVFNSNSSILDGSDIELDRFNDIAFAAIAATSKFPLAISEEDFANQVKELNSGYGFKKQLEMPVYNNKHTIKAFYKINKIEEKHKDNLLIQKYNIIVAILTYNGDKELKRDGVQQEITITVPRTNNAGVIQYELLKAMYPMISKLAEEF